ncbi:MAG: right-handed parallel beta-helix repeat-containing protein [Candidatus Sulfotelmatobacter sp.]
MKRREFLKLSASAALAGVYNQGKPLNAVAAPESAEVITFHVSSSGKDSNPGTVKLPFATLHRAQEAVRRRRNRSAPVTVVVREGTYYLERPLTFGPEDSGSKEAPTIYAAHPEERVTISGGRKLFCKWRPYGNGIMMAEVAPGMEFTQLFVNGKRQIRARYPNYDPSNPGKSGYVQAAGSIRAGTVDPYAGPNDDMTFSTAAPRGIRFDPASFTKKRWAHPEEAEIHIFQDHYWGNLQWKINGVDFGTDSIWFGDGGQQIGAKWSKNPAVVGEGSRFFIDNVFEELDAPGEWFLDKHKGTLYYYPEPGTDLRTALVEAPILDHAIEFAGTQRDPVQYVSVRGFRIAHAATTYLEAYEVPSLSDWAIHRGGSVFAEGTRNCSIEACWFDAVGGNAIFVNNYNREFSVVGCKFTETGDSAICFVGDLEKTNGTQRAFPYECQASNNLIHDCGFYGKQIAGVYVSRAKRITASHNLIYNMPRAAICIGDGTWGGHVIEFNQTHDTVRETSDHGPFNAWGRDRGWALAQSHAPYTPDRSLDVWEALVDAMEPVIVRNNFFDEKSGWGLDLDDGASNYEIYNNISVGGVSMKLREGAYRKVYNNIWYLSKGAPCFHVGNNYNHDQYFNNITVMDPGSTPWPDGWPWWPQMFYSVIAPPAVGPWLEKIDNNCFYCLSGEFQAVVDQLRSEDGKRNPKRYNLEEWRNLGFDQHSVFADPIFVDPDRYNFQVRPESPALKAGFKNFEMGKWGLTSEFSKQWHDSTS